MDQLYPHGSQRICTRLRPLIVSHPSNQRHPTDHHCRWWLSAGTRVLCTADRWSRLRGTKLGKGDHADRWRGHSRSAVTKNLTSHRNINVSAGLGWIIPGQRRYDFDDRSPSPSGLHVVTLPAQIQAHTANLAPEDIACSTLPRRSPHVSRTNS